MPVQCETAAALPKPALSGLLRILQMKPNKSKEKSFVVTTLELNTDRVLF